ncbi:MAG: hypothetical protein IH819_07585 [Bacteroidetes bacterium]|nr:hypothetical protein [Bacteroidota bacterium]
MNKEYSNFVLIDHPLVKKDITVIRDVQTDCESFRAAISRVANIIAVNLSENLSLIEVEVETPLEKTKLLEEIFPTLDLLQKSGLL